MPSSSSWMTMLAPARAKGPLDEDLLDGAVGLGHVAADQDAFAQRQAVGFDGATSAQRGGKARRGGGVGEGARARGGDAVLLHEPLGEDFGGLELGGLPVRAPDAQPVFLPQIHDAQRQRIVRADDGEVGVVAPGRRPARPGRSSAPRLTHWTGAPFCARRSWAMPALPGAHHIWVTWGDWASFQTRACSRPPEPMTRIFMGGIQSGIATRAKAILRNIPAGLFPVIV